MEKYGIENLKKVVIWKTNLLEEIAGIIKKAQEKKAKGKKLTGWAALQFIDNLIAGFRLAGNYEQIGLEWMDLDESEKKELQVLVKEQLDIEHEFAEEVAERLFYLTIEIGDTLTFIFSKKKQK